MRSSIYSIINYSVILALAVTFPFVLHAQNHADSAAEELALLNLQNVEDGWFFYPHFLTVEPINQLDYLSMSGIGATGSQAFALGSGETTTGEFKTLLFGYEDGEWDTIDILDMDSEDGTGVHAMPLQVTSSNNINFSTGYNYVRLSSGEITVLDPENSEMPEALDEDEYITDIEGVGLSEHWLLTSSARLIHRNSAAFELFDHENSALPEDSSFGTELATRSLAWTGSELWLHLHQEEGGLYLFDPNADEWQHFTAENSDLPGDFVNSVVYRDDVTWVSVLPHDGHSGGLVRIDESGWTVLTDDDIPAASARVQAIGPDGEVYAQFTSSTGTDNTREGGFWVYDGDSWNSLADPGEFYQSLGSVEVSNETVIWMAGTFNVINGGVGSLAGTYVTIDQAPEEGIIMASGSSVTIGWEKGELITTTTVSYSTDEGETWTEIESEMESTVLFYDLPEGNEDTFRFRVQADNYPGVYDESDDFTVLDPDVPFYHVRNLHPDGLYEFFDPEIHGFGFENNDREVMWISEEWEDIEYSGFWDSWPLNGEPHQFPPFYALDDAFGTSNTRKDFFTSERPTVPAAILWGILKSQGYNGVCHGFALASSIGFSHGHSALNSSFGAGINEDVLFDQEATQDVKDMIYRIWTQQWGLEHLTATVFNSLDLSTIQTLVDLVISGNFDWDDLPSSDEYFKSPSETLQEIKDMMAEPGPGEYYRALLLIPPSSISDAHSIFPYKVEEASEDGVYYVYVYENNDAGNTDRRITINTNTEYWNYGSSENFQGSYGLFLSDSAQNYRSQSNIVRPVPEDRIIMYDGEAIAMEDLSLEDIGYMYTLFGTETDINLENENGEQVATEELAISNDIPGTLPIVNGAGEPTEAFGMFLPDFEYDVELNYRSDTIGQFSAVTGGTSYSFFNSEVNIESPDRMRYGNSLTVFGKDDDPDFNFGLNVNESLDDDNLFYRIEDFELSSAGEVTFRLGDDAFLEITNLNSEAVFNFQVGRDSESEEFLYEGLELNPDHGYQLEPDWDDVSNPELTLRIDTNLDGEYDQTDIITGMDTSEPGDGETGQLPDQYELHNNYPNPFNPTTIIEYSIPEHQQVTLEVYNMLGQRVSVLVDEVQNAGRHQAVFDATGLSSGMYIYRITAGSFTETQKMMFVK